MIGKKTEKERGEMKKMKNYDALPSFFLQHCKIFIITNGSSIKSFHGQLNLEDFPWAPLTSALPTDKLGQMGGLGFIWIPSSLTKLRLTLASFDGKPNP